MGEKDMRERMAEMLKYHRIKADMTVYDVGEKVGKSGKTVDAWEHGRGQPDADMLLKLCSLYEVPSVGAFFGEDCEEITGRHLPKPMGWARRGAQGPGRPWMDGAEESGMRGSMKACGWRGNG